MAMVPLADQGNVLHVYDFRVKPGTGDEFIRLFNEFDYSDDNLMHKSKAQVKDGVLCRHSSDRDRFFLIGEWRSIAEHSAALTAQMARPRPKFFDLLADKWAPTYVDVVASTPLQYLNK
jgi:hypothetical protein